MTIPAADARALPRWPLLTGALVLVALAVAAGAWSRWGGLMPRNGDTAARDAAPVLLQERRAVHYPDGAPELAFLRIETAAQVPEPALAPLPGRLAYDENVTARVFSPIAGRIVSLHVQAGDAVKKGDPLATLDAPEFAAAYADLRKADADLRARSLALSRVRDLVDGGVAPRKDLEGAQSDHDAAAAEAARARSRLANLGPPREGDRYVLRAPIDGRVVERQANPGAEVRPDAAAPLFVLSDTTRLWMVVDLPERDLARVQPGAVFSVESDAYPGRAFASRVFNVADTLDPATRRVMVRASLPNPERLLKPEMFVRATLLSDSGARAVRVPASAIVTDGLYSTVFVETEPNVFRRQRVTVGVQSRDTAWVREGLNGGERVVVQGGLLLASELAGSS